MGEIERMMQKHLFQRYLNGESMLLAIKGIRQETNCSLAEAFHILYYRMAFSIESK